MRSLKNAKYNKQSQGKLVNFVKKKKNPMPPLTNHNSIFQRAAQKEITDMCLCLIKHCETVTKRDSLCFLVYGVAVG